MKNLLTKNNLPNHSSLRKVILWVFLHLAVILLFIQFGSIAVDTSLFGILPESSKVNRLSVPVEIMENRFTSGITVLIGHPEFKRAKEAMLSFATLLRKQGFINIQDTVDPLVMKEAAGFLYSHRYMLMSPGTRELLEQKNEEELINDTFSRLMSPLSLGGLEFIELDPFLFTADLLDYYLRSGFLGDSRLGIRDNVLTAEHEGVSWVLLRAETPSAGFTLDSDALSLEELYSLRTVLVEISPEMRILFSGVPFHSYNSALNSQKEITLLSAVSTLFIIFLLITVFRSPVPLLGASVVISTALFSGLIVSMTVFEEIHIFTIVFGTSLIGISVDYLFHFFCEWGNIHDNESSPVSRVLPGIRVGLVTTVISYSAITLTGFPLLLQMAVFSVAGLLSTFSSVLLLFPLLPPASQRTGKSLQIFTRFIEKAVSFLSRIDVRKKAVFLIPVGLVIILGGIQIKLENNVRQLYTMDTELLTAETLTADIIGTGSSSSYVLVEGESTQDVLEKEERFIKLLEDQRDSNFQILSVTRIIPSALRQVENYQAVRSVLPSWVKRQYRNLGFSEEMADLWEEDFRSHADRIIDPGLLKNEIFLENILGLLWLGDTGNAYYSAVIFQGLDDPTSVLAVADRIAGVHVIDTVGEINRSLQRISVFSIAAVFAAYLVIFLILIPRYGVITSLTLIGIPGAASVFTAALLSLSGIPLQLFIIMGCILVPGMGTDYIIFTIEGGRFSATTVLAVTLSMTTTVLAFGMLGFTTFLGLFGITVSIGIVVTYILTLLFLTSERGIQDLNI